MIDCYQDNVGWNELAIAWGLTLSLTLTVAVVMRRPLYAITQYICGTETGARFWTAYSTVMLVVGPLFLVSFGSYGSANTAEFVRRTTMLISLGQIITVAIMGIAVRACKPATQPATAGHANIPPSPARSGDIHAAPAE